MPAADAQVVRRPAIPERLRMRWTMFQAIGAYLDAFAFIALGLAGQHYAHRWVSKEGSPEEVQRREDRMRKASRVVLIGGLGFLVIQILGI